MLTVCLGKSTYARCGILVNVTPFEPEWEGYVTLEFSNTTPLPAKIYANEGVAQVVFFESDEVCETSYKDRGGKYQGQRGVTLPEDVGVKTECLLHCTVLRFKQLDSRAVLPKRGSALAAGLDVCALDQDSRIRPKERAIARDRVGGGDTAGLLWSSCAAIGLAAKNGSGFACGVY